MDLPRRFIKEDSDIETDEGRNSPTSSPCYLTYNDQIRTLLTEAQKIPKNTQTRLISQVWPRDPNGEIIRHENSLPGKEAPNGIQLWGATILDFYLVRRIPGVGNLSGQTYSTGSKLAAWMKEHKELEWAAEEIKWAEMEEDPYEIEPWNVAEILEEQEGNIQKRKSGWGKPMPKVESHAPNSSIFHPSNYPAPWPLMPFSYPTERLQRRLSYRELPQKLVVHDPWRLLGIREQGSEDINKNWSEMKDVTKLYHLQLSDEGNKTLQDERKVAKEQQEKINERGFFLDPPIPSSDPIAPPIYVLHPPRPVSPLTTEAHLYLSPAHCAGEGNHSIVYHAELELPRETLTPFLLCMECVREDVHRILAIEDGENGERMDEKWKVKDTMVTMVESTGRGIGVRVTKKSNSSTGPPETAYIVLEPEPTSRIQVSGTTRPIRTTVPWRNASHPPTCKHFEHHASSANPHPPTAKVRVAAKLSIQNDNHLHREAANYQKFASHLFQHYSGFNLVPPLHDPVPVSAVVPQFYGYYVPEDHGKDKNEDKVTYESPILLLEDCGTPIDPAELNKDDMQECASLYYRFHYAGWTHGSVASRNILIQPGPIDLPPEDREYDPPIMKPDILGRACNFLVVDPYEVEMNGEKYTQDTSDRRTNLSFRLIDFGRSLQRGNGEHQAARAEEEVEVNHLFCNFLY